MVQVAEPYKMVQFYISQNKKNNLPEILNHREAV